MTDAQFTQIVNSIRKEISDRTPYDTGNLAINATRIESLGANEMRIYIDVQIAPYFKYLNFHDTVGTRGKPNTNKGYWERALKSSLEKIAIINGAEVRSV